MIQAGGKQKKGTGPDFYGGSVQNILTFQIPEHALKEQKDRQRTGSGFRDREHS